MQYRNAWSFPLLLSMAAAQGVPLDGAVVCIGSASQPAPSEGVWIIAPNGGVTPVRGLASRLGGVSVYAVQLDPVDDRIWLGGDATNGQLSWIRTDPSGSVVGFAAHAALGAPLAITGITFDDNGNPIVSAAGGNPPVGGIFAIDRQTGVVARLASDPNRNHVSITRSTEGDVYFSAGRPFGGFSTQIQRLRKERDCTFQPPTLVHERSGTIHGLEWTAGRTHPILVFVGSTRVWEVAASVGGAEHPVGPTHGGPVEFDRRGDRFLLALLGPSAVNALSSDYRSLTRYASLANGVAGTITGIDSHDGLDAELSVAPACPARGLPITVDIGVTCPAGQIAVLHLVAPASVPLAIAPAPAHGRVFSRLSGIHLPRVMIPGLFVFQAACIDVATGRLTVGPRLPWPSN